MPRQQEPGHLVEAIPARGGVTVSSGCLLQPRLSGSDTMMSRGLTSGTVRGRSPARTKRVAMSYYKNMSTPHEQFLQNLYAAFNRREIEPIISVMRPDVKWANGLEGGFVYGRDAVREYWTEQFESIQPRLEALKFEADEDDRNVVTVHQVIRDLQGNVLADMTVRQIFTIEDGLISLYEIGDAETIQEVIRKTRPSDER